MNEIVKVRFYDDELDAIQDGDRVLVGIRRACENLGLDYSGQRQKLSDTDRCPWATVVVMPSVADDGKTREMAFLDLDAVPMWLATIDASRCAEEIRPKITRYQKECARVLRDHFFGKPSTAIVPKSSAEIALQMAQALVDQERRQREIETRQVQAEDRIQRIEARQEAAEKGVSYFSVIAFSRYKRLGPVDLMTAQAVGKQCAEACKAQGIPIGRVRDQRFGLVNSYPESVLEVVFALRVS